MALGYEDLSAVSSKTLPSEFDRVSIYKSLQVALEKATFDTAFICTPTSHHVKSLLQLLEKRVENIFVEKPLSHNTEQIAELLAKAWLYNNNIKVGYDLHFDPGLQKIRALLKTGTIGNIVSINAFCGQYLPLWRPYEDHRKGMSAKMETGGGVLLDIVHEFDYLRWLAGDIASVACWHTNSGELDIETEEAADVLMKFTNGTIGTVHLDYLQPTLVRHCTFTGTKGSITANLAKCHVEWMLHDGTKGEFGYAGFERNDRFKEIIKAFLENNTDDRLTSLSDALQSLLVVEAAKKSSKEGRSVALSSILIN